MRYFMVIPKPSYLGVYDYENPDLSANFHQNNFDIVGGIFQEILPPLIECALYMGISSGNEDDTLYSYAEEIYHKTILEKYQQYSSELVYFIHDNQTDLVNMSVYLSTALADKISNVMSGAYLGVVINDIHYRYGHYQIRYSTEEKFEPTTT